MPSVSRQRSSSARWAAGGGAGSGQVAEDGATFPAGTNPTRILPADRPVERGVVEGPWIHYRSGRGGYISPAGNPSTISSTPATATEIPSTSPEWPGAMSPQLSKY
jgi:hypothetical protein